MPNIFEYLGLIFKFYSKEHDPPHVHIEADGMESKVELEYENGKLKEIKFKKVKGKKPLALKQQKEAKDFIEKYHRKIVEKWVQFFIFGKEVKKERINKKL